MLQGERRINWKKLKTHLQDRACSWLIAFAPTSKFSFSAQASFLQATWTGLWAGGDNSAEVGSAAVHSSFGLSRGVILAAAGAATLGKQSPKVHSLVTFHRRLQEWCMNSPQASSLEVGGVMCWGENEHYGTMLVFQETPVCQGKNCFGNMVYIVPCHLSGECGWLCCKAEGCWSSCSPFKCRWKRAVARAGE